MAVKDLTERMREAILSNQEAHRLRGPLWPTRYADNTFESAWAFVREQWTWDESASQEVQMPDIEFIEQYCWEWHDCMKRGVACITEKCRRMVISWTARSLELHQLGIGRCDQILAGEDLEAAAKHVWRLKFLYQGLQRRHPAWKLPEHNELKYEGERKLKTFGLSNGSVCNYANGQSEGLQGDGIRIITLEEFGTYRYGSSMLAQAKIITTGRAGHLGGFTNVITNATPGFQWQQVKKGVIFEDVC